MNSAKKCPQCGETYQNSQLVVCPKDRTMLMTLNKDSKVIEELVIGTVLNDRYLVTDLMKVGSKANIYKAKHELMDRLLAIKMLKPALVTDQIAIKRFQQEAQAASHIEHPGSITVFDYGFFESGQPFLVMDYLKGKSLAEYIDEQGSPLSEVEFKSIFSKICSALGEIHKRGVVHRDIKPNHFILNKDYGPVLIDFGTAKLTPSSEKQDMNLTQTGEVLGTPLYMSPEQCYAASVDPRTDIYQLGCCMFLALTGRPPFTGSDEQVMEAHTMNKFPDHVIQDQKLEAVVKKAMAKNPRDRFESAEELCLAFGGRYEIYKREEEKKGLFGFLKF